MNAPMTPAVAALMAKTLEYYLARGGDLRPAAAVERKAAA